MGLLSILSCCSKISGNKDDYLTIPKTEYTGNQLRTDGYYYEKWDNKIYSISFFYNNGVFLDIGGRQEENEVDNYISIVAKDKLPQGFWGAFLSTANKITIEKFVGSDKGYEVYRYEGEIINEDSFILRESSRIKQGQKTDTRDINRTYYFRAFSPKPDSTNNFIK